MKIKGNIKFNYDNEDNAKLAYESLEVDNENYLKSELNENSVEYSLDYDNIGSFLRTADDLIASEIVVEKIITNTNFKY
ncbi:KEOPS complex subunit Pcc1 [Methanobrevibacter sp.]|uniref:KEOPS complex subunit Pcc1 n=1 Tax=Methanobrevibacter sp. TaxID=66852 RepID=UPI0038901307